MKKQVTRTSYPGWNNYPVYRCNTFDDYNEVLTWMLRNKCKEFLLQSCSTGVHVFQVKSNHAWFVLRWE